jgi:hypothetical protein
VSSSDYLDPLIAALQALKDWLRAVNVPFVVIGGVAASLLGRPRLTQDVDIAVYVDPAEWEQLFAVGLEHGFEARRSNALEFATQHRVLLIRHPASGIKVDVALGALLFEEQIDSSSATDQYRTNHDTARDAGRSRHYEVNCPSSSRSGGYRSGARPTS